MDSHFDADLLRARLHHVLNLVHLLLPKLFQIPRPLVEARNLLHGRMQQIRAMLDFNSQVVLRLDIPNGLLQLALPNVAPRTNLKS